MTPAELAAHLGASERGLRRLARQARADGLRHMAALALFLFGTGARVGEATALSWGDVDLTEATATIRLYKPRPWIRTAHLSPPVVAAFAKLGTRRAPELPVFGLADRGSVTKTWNNTARRAGLDPPTPHCCRHGCATAMLRQGFDLSTVARRGGWNDPATVLRTYAHAPDNRAVTDALFGTGATQGDGCEFVESSSKGRKRQSGTPLPGAGCPTAGVTAARPLAQTGFSR